MTMTAILSLTFTLTCLLSKGSAGFSTVYSSQGGATSVQHFQPLPQPSHLNTWTQLPQEPQTDSYLPQPQQPQVQPQPQLPQQYHIQTQPPIAPPAAPLATDGGLQLSPLPTQSIFNPRQPINFNLAGQNSFFYSPRDQALYKVTKISLNQEKVNPQYGPPPTTTTTTTTTNLPTQTASNSDSTALLPPTPAAPPATPRPYYRERPSYRINFTVYENSGPQSGAGCRGGGEGRNPALSPIFGAEADDDGCPPAAPVGGSPQFGVPEPLPQDPESSQGSPEFQLPPVPSEDGSSGTGRVPSSTYGVPPSKYGPPPKYGAPATTPKPKDDNGLAGTGSRPGSNRQISGLSFTADGTIG